MVGGTVIEVAESKRRPNLLWVNTADMPKGRRKPDTCAICVKKTALSLRIEIGDSLWWQGVWAYWTPKENRRVSSGGKGGVDYDIKIERVGFSGVTHPDTWEEAVEGQTHE